MLKEADENHTKGQYTIHLKDTVQALLATTRKRPALVTTPI